MTDTKPELRIVESGQTDAGLATLELISQARQALAEARTLPDIRRVIEAASVAKDASQRAARLYNAERRAVEVVEAATAAANDAATIRIEAQAKAGELLAQMRESGERAKGGEAGRRESQPVTLGELGIGRMESSRWQQVAAVPPDVRAEYVEETRAAKGEVSTDGLLKHIKSRAAQPTGEPAQAPEEAEPPLDGRQKLVHELQRALEALTTYPPGLAASLAGDEHARFYQATRRAAWWLAHLTAEVRRTTPRGEVHNAQVREDVYQLVWELRGACGDPAAAELGELVDGVPLDDRPELLAAVRAIAAWLADLEGELNRQGAGEQLEEIADDGAELGRRDRASEAADR
jgi:hypothetical protein